MDAPTRSRSDPHPRSTMRAFHSLTRHTDLLADRFGAPTAAVMRREMLEEYRALLPDVPDIGGRRNPQSQALVLAPWALALYRVLARHGGSVEDAGEVIHDVMRRRVGRIPRALRHRMGKRSFRADRAARNARWSQQHRYPDDFRYEVVDGAGQPFDYGVDFTQCAIVRYLHAQGADELTPYLCDLDYVMASAMGVGLVRTKTLAWGCDRCDFRFTVPGRTAAPWPPRFRERTCGLPVPEPEPVPEPGAAPGLGG